MVKPFGTAAYKLVRVEGPETSVESAYSVNSAKLEKLVLGSIAEFGQRGCISDEVRFMHPGLPYSSITARYKALVDGGHIYFTGEKRKGCSTRMQRVMTASIFKKEKN